jgi:ribulose kinase
MLGSAILAAVGSGHYDSIQSAAGQMVQIARTIEPDQARHAAYAEACQAYKVLYPALAGIARPWHQRWRRSTVTWLSPAPIPLKCRNGASGSPRSDSTPNA